MTLTEIQIDRIVGPTHHYGGLGVGNLASVMHHGQKSNPKAAALQGIDKMRRVAELGVPQFVLPPQRRPHEALVQPGDDLDQPAQIRRLLHEAPDLLSAVSSSSAMWTANAATVTPMLDSIDGRTHLTIANLCSSLHRSIEPPQTFADLSGMGELPSAQLWQPLPASVPLRDEGAANHMRLCDPVDERPGIHVFVYGESKDQAVRPQRFFARQTRRAFEWIARQHCLPIERCFFIQQSPMAIDAGAFHNDVVAMSHHHLWIHHESAYAETTDFAKIEKCFSKLSEQPLKRIVVSKQQLPLAEAVQTYLFNSQILSTTRGGAPEMICPMQVHENERSRSLVDRWIDEGHFSGVHFVELRQSMAGGGGPACLRLRVPLERRQMEQLTGITRWTDELDQRLRSEIESHYADQLSLADLCDPDRLAATKIVHQNLSALLSN